MQKSQYRPDIDGLRAIAVVSVLLFHAGFSLFPGGYVGVDVFFVISGFLITKLIREEVIATNGFSFSRFYIRRIRRLFPALFVTLFLTAVFSALILSPQHLQEFGKSLLFAIVSVSNFFFWLEAGYFDTASEMKPLLHTWSLSVEEQFYLIWPAALVVLLKWGPRAVAPLGLFAAGIISLWLNFFVADIREAGQASGLAEWVPSSSAATFYLLPFRVFEFAIGGLLVWLAPVQFKNKFLMEILALIGFGLIAYSVFFFTKDTPFPSYNALFPCVGAALIIFSGKAFSVRMLLSNKASVRIGLISYSLYLVHWPLIVFWSYLKVEPMSVSDGLSVIAISLVLAELMYRFVEKPFRNPASQFLKKNYITVSFSALLTIFVALPAYSMAYAHSGWEWRIAEERQVLQLDPKTYHRKHYGGVGIPNHRVVTLGQAEVEPGFLITGDSHARQYANAINELLSENGVGALGLFDGGCMVLPDAVRYKNGELDEDCVPKYKEAKRILNAQVDLDLFLVHQWKGYAGGNMVIGPRDGSGPFEFNDISEYNSYVIDQTEKFILSNGRLRNYYLIGVPEAFRGDKRQSLIDCLYRPSLFSNNCGFESPRTNLPINEELKGLAEKYDYVTYVDPKEALCGRLACRNVIEGLPVHSDGAHLSKVGAEQVIRHFSEHFVKQLGYSKAL